MDEPRNSSSLYLVNQMAFLWKLTTIIITRLLNKLKLELTDNITFSTDILISREILTQHFSARVYLQFFGLFIIK